MINDKNSLLKTILPDTVKDIDYTQINLDICDLSISDILRNLNTMYPPNSRNRNKIADGELALGVLCKTKTLEPYSGLFILITKTGIETNFMSYQYIVLCISEDRIKNEESLIDLIDDITKYLISSYSSDMNNLPDFYRKYVYNESEIFDEIEYNPSGY